MPGQPKLDRIDIKILSCLQREGDLSNVRLAEQVGLSPSPCLQRVKRLRSAGYIIGYSAHIDYRKLADCVTVFTEVQLSDHRREDFVKFESSVKDVDELIECHLLSGGYDYLLRFVVRSVAHYQEVIERLVDRNIGIEKYFSYIVLKTPLLRGTPAIDALMGKTG